MGGEFNTKNTYWRSRLNNPKGKELYKAILETGCEVVSTGNSTYWATDNSKTSDLIDFFITNKISKSYVKLEN